MNEEKLAKIENEIKYLKSYVDHECYRRYADQFVIPMLIQALRDERSKVAELKEELEIIKQIQLEEDTYLY